MIMSKVSDNKVKVKAESGSRTSWNWKKKIWLKPEEEDLKVLYSYIRCCIVISKVANKVKVDQVWIEGQGQGLIEGQGQCFDLL